MHFDEQKHNLTFSFDSNDGERHLEMNCNELYIDDILDRFKEFLQGCGYEIDGMIDVVPYVVPHENTQFDFSAIPKNNWPFGEKKRDDIAYTNLTYPSEK
jgi:hypothetical protein